MCQYGVVNNCFITICCAIKKSQNLLNWINMLINVREKENQPEAATND
nr:MAG TPA: hypothetical protein [Caudoviricetes sp.]